MKLEKLCVGSFGKLEDREFLLSDGLNIVYGKNESGKSTLSSFIKYILYGFSSQKSRSVHSNDKLKYLSWKTGTVFGSAQLSVDETEESGNRKQYRIERFNSSKSTLKVTDRNGKEYVFGKEPGEALLGVDEAAFLKMAFIRQTDISADKMTDIADHIRNTVYSADETVDIEKARKKLNDYRNAYRGKTRKTGRFYELEEKVHSLRRDLDEAAEKHKALLEAEARLEETKQNIAQNEKKLNDLDSEVKNIEAFEAKKLLEKIKEAEAKLLETKHKYSSAKSEFSFFEKTNSEKAMEAVSVLESTYADYMRKKNELAEAENKLAQTENERKEKEKETSPLLFTRFEGCEMPDTEALKAEEAKLKADKLLSIVFAVLMFAAAVATAVSGTMKLFAIPDLYMLSLCAGFAAAGVVFSVIAAVKAKKAAALFKSAGFESKDDFYAFAKEFPEAMTRRREYAASENVLVSEIQRKKVAFNAAEKDLKRVISVLELSENGNSNDFSSKDGLIAELKSSAERFKSAENELFRAQSIYDGICESKNIDELNDAAKAFSHMPEREKASVLREREYYLLATKNLEEKEKDYIRLAAAPASSVRKPSEILAEKTATEALLAKAAENADAAEMALEALDKACEELKSGVSPHIAARACELFSIFTDGKYGSLEVSHEFAMGIPCGGVSRDSGYLSQGTQDAAYLALRIAMCEILFSEKPVLVLDEAFAYIDDERLEVILSALVKLSKDFQILIFTCHEREKKALSQISGVNVIEL